jgi:NAD(P)-dependent dehydrogenase (short-subunit alcohol dehydrogenase family)
VPVALVTGASRGIGRAVAVELVRVGYDVAVNYHANQAAAEETRAQAAAARPGAHVEVVAADVGETGSRTRLLTFVRDAFGRLDLLVNNAGVAPAERADLLEATEESFDRVLGVNLKGPYFLSQAAARWMVEQRKTAGGDYHPAIVNVSSISAEAASTNRGDYCVAKAGVGMMTQLFAARLADHGIHVYEVRPGIIATDMTAAVKEKYDAMFAEGVAPIRRWGTPEDVARAVGAIAQGALPYSTGEVIHVDGGFHIRRL